MMLFAAGIYLIAGVVTLLLPKQLTNGMGAGQYGLALGYFFLSLAFALLSLFGPVPRPL